MNVGRPIPDALFREVHQLADGVLSGTLSDEQCTRLDQLVCTDTVARQLYVRYIFNSDSLRTWSKSVFAEMYAGDQTLALDDLNKDAICPEISTHGVIFTDSLETPIVDNTAHNTVGYLFSGWPVAYLLATVIVGVSLLISSIMHVSHPEQMANQSLLPSRVDAEPKSQLVGRITGMVDCKWTGAASDSSWVPIGKKYELASGLIEITYDSGAVVILQGPATYEVESRAGGFLSIGKLTAKVDKKEERRTKNEERSGRNSSFLIPHSYFAVRTPTAIVTDLGTEFGVEVSQEGHTTSHVFRGSVELRTVPSDMGSPPVARVLHENESAEVKGVDGNERVTAIVPTIAQPNFVRALPKTTLKTFDLVDVVAGGDGFSGRRNSGIDPTSGRVTDTSPQLDKDFTFVGDGKYHRVDGLPFLDGVFIPDGQPGPVQTDSAGHAFAGFGATANRTGGHVWAGGTVPTSVDHPRAIRTQLGNIDYAAAGHGLLFLHANKGITFDLNAIRQANPHSKLVRFRSAAGNTETVSAQGLAVFADIWVLVDGQTRFQRREINSENGEFAIVVPLRETDRFLTLAATDGGNDIGNDWILFGDPRLELMTQSEAH